MPWHLPSWAWHPRVIRHGRLRRLVRRTDALLFALWWESLP